jgi:hypothetical protein
VENRIADVRRAQHGNLTLYNTWDPFIGTGIIPYDLIGKGKKDDLPVWSIAVELSRAGASRDLLGYSERDRVDIDPVELHKVLRARLYQLNDQRLPPSQRVAYITVDDHVVGEGRLDWSSPLIDRQRMIPYSQVSTEAAEALARAPQGRLRYYQRVSISDEGQPVLTHVNTGSGTQNVQVNKSSREATLDQVDQLVARLLASLAELPAQNAAVAAGELVAFKAEAHEPSPHEGRLRQALSRLGEAAAPAAGMIELAQKLAELIGQLVH